MTRRERLYRQHCYACHALEPGRNTPAGPNLHGIVGRVDHADPQIERDLEQLVILDRHRREHLVALARELGEDFLGLRTVAPESAGPRLITLDHAGARYFSDSATLVPNDVGNGQAAAGMAIWCLLLTRTVWMERTAATGNSLA